jgi:hypothetical protein
MKNPKWRVSVGPFGKGRERAVTRRVLAVVLMVGAFLFFGSAAAFATGPSISVRPNTGLTGGKTVTVVGSGLAAGAKGYVMECNEAPGEPTVRIGPPFDESLPIGCSAPSLKRIVSTTANGTLATTTIVHEGRKLGPPCGVFPIIAGCAHADSAGQRPRGDAQNYPCPPSPAQQVAGVTCALVFVDTSHDQAAAPIVFLGPKAPPPPPTTTPGTTGTTSPGTTGTTAPGTTGTTAPGTTPTTAAHGSTPVPGATTGGSPAAATKPASASAPGSTSPGSVTASSGSLAFTGLGSVGKVLAVVGGILLLLGLVLYFFDVKKLAAWFLGL